MTTYRVFKQSDFVNLPDGEPDSQGDAFVPLGTFDAHTAKAAIQQAVLAMTDTQRKEADGATFAATPDGSWTELTVGVAVETKVTVA